jgi:predicted nucleic acid-binding protein
VNGLVVDASVAIKWFVDQPDSAEAVAVLRHPIAAPDLLAPECANILWTKVARGELRADEAETIALALEAADITLHSTRPYLAAVTQIACALGRAACDCFYLALGERLQQPLVTADRRLVDAIRVDRSKRFAHHVVALSEFSAK